VSAARTKRTEFGHGFRTVEKRKGWSNDGYEVRVLRVWERVLGAPGEHEPDEDQIMCPNCGSARVEPDHFDPDEPVENPFEEPEEGHGT
jgi:hypothetical protein